MKNGDLVSRNNSETQAAVQGLSWRIHQFSSFKFISLNAKYTTRQMTARPSRIIHLLHSITVRLRMLTQGNLYPHVITHQI